MPEKKKRINSVWLDNLKNFCIIIYYKLLNIYNLQVVWIDCKKCKIISWNKHSYKYNFPLSLNKLAHKLHFLGILIHILEF